MSRLAEGVALAIETAYSQHVVQGDTDCDLAPLACAALFHGRNTPLLFGQRVRDLLESGDTVQVYSNISCDDADGIGIYSHLDSDDEYPVIIDYACNAGGECVFVPLSEETAAATAGNASTSLASANTAIMQQSATTSVAALVVALAARVSMKHTSHTGSVLSVGNIDMSSVGRLVSRAPLKARFINVLVHPPLLRAFMGFCTLPSEMALKSLLYVLDVERFRHV
ncbi:hypothetical protein H4R20_004773 [Coemansia guatemalensis]|uniref:Uncharacterized protein n=1 Tax=Coemansia guatemalensis TaxID=2761395 RepID=A0A9W8HQU5_9FUNG|nr:hypothetical protein H4R20_004773 [Coemansia guatemalensis]